MMNIYENIERIKIGIADLIYFSRALYDRYKECDYLKLYEATEKNLRLVSSLYLDYRDLLFSLYELMPSLHGTAHIYNTVAESLNISVERVRKYPYPVYKISLPFLLPNKRGRQIDHKNAITNTVRLVVRQFCAENDVSMFNCATVIFLSYYDVNKPNLIDNDNKEGSVIQNGLIGSLLRDDRQNVCQSIYYSLPTAEGAKTEIYVVESDHDVEVLSVIKRK